MNKTVGHESFVCDLTIASTQIAINVHIVLYSNVSEPSLENFTYNSNWLQTFFMEKSHCV